MVSVIVMAVSGIAAPVGSVTEPFMDVTDCEKTLPATSDSKAKAQNTRVTVT